MATTHPQPRPNPPPHHLPGRLPPHVQRRHKTLRLVPPCALPQPSPHTRLYPPPPPTMPRKLPPNPPVPLPDHPPTRPHRRSRFKHPSLNRPRTPWKSWSGGARRGGAGGRGKRGRWMRRCTGTPSSHFRGAQAWRSQAFAPRKLPCRAIGDGDASSLPPLPPRHPWGRNPRDLRLRPPHSTDPSIPLRLLFSPWMAGHPCLTLRARSLSLQGDPANIGKG